jgi:hypothetical protein
MELAMVGETIRGLADPILKVWDRWAAGHTDRKRKERLTEMLSDPRFEFRRLSALTDAIGADEDTAKRLLVEIGARPSERADSSYMWTLKPPPSGHGDTSERAGQD